MNTTNIQTNDPVEWGPLVLHIRRLRQWYGESGISQKELGQIAGVSNRALMKLESCRELPKTVEMLIRISLALRVPIEGLLDPYFIDKTRTTIDRKRTSQETQLSKKSKAPDNLPIYES